MKRKEKQNWLIAGGALLGLLLLSSRAKGATGGGTGAGAGVANLSYLGQSGLPRGMRNNNPGNIRISNTPWQGKIPASQNTDKAFEQFRTWAYGIRAMIKNLQYYQTNRNLNNLTQIISTWAPAADNNDTTAYIAAVSLETGLSPTAYLNLQDQNTMRKLVKAMSRVENGRQAVTDAQFNYAWSIV